MITITEGHVTDVTHLGDLGRFTARVRMTYRYDDDPGTRCSATILASVPLPAVTRFPRVEAALLASAARELRRRMARIGSGPLNIFAEDGALPLVRAA